MKHLRAFFISALAALSAFCLFSCAWYAALTEARKPEPVAVRKAGVPPAPEERKRYSSMPPEEQEEKSTQVFERILNLTEGIDRDKNLPEIEKAYYEVMKKYPDSLFAQESYWRLMLLNIKEKNPPRFDEVERLYAEFGNKYPDSNFHYPIDDTLVRQYYRHERWDELISICTPYVMDYIETGSLRSPFFLFFFSEAKLNLHDYAEAEKGFKTVLIKFPSTTEGIVSKQRIEMLEELKKQGR